MLEEYAAKDRPFYRGYLEFADAWRSAQGDLSRDDDLDDFLAERLPLRLSKKVKRKTEKKGKLVTAEVRTAGL